MISENSNRILKIAIEALNDKKADNIKVIDITEISSVSDVMIICSGNNINHIHAMADEVEEKLARNKYKPVSYEGYEKANWILIDYYDVVIHFFDKESRNFYDLERLYRDGINIDVDDFLNE